MSLRINELHFRHVLNMQRRQHFESTVRRNMDVYYGAQYAVSCVMGPILLVSSPPLKCHYSVNQTSTLNYVNIPPPSNLSMQGSFIIYPRITIKK